MTEMSMPEREKTAKPFIMELGRKEWTTPFDISKKMEGGMNRLNIAAAETMMRRMDGTMKEEEGDTALVWIWKNQTGKGAWLKKTIIEENGRKFYS